MLEQAYLFKQEDEFYTSQIDQISETVQTMDSGGQLSLPVPSTIGSLYS